MAALNVIYGGGNGPISFNESNTRHTAFNGTSEVTIDAATLTGIEVIGDAAARAAAATMAFDEALTKDEVKFLRVSRFEARAVGHPGRARTLALL